MQIVTTNILNPLEKAVVIIPTIGSKETRKAIESVLSQTHPTTCYVICDGEEYWDKTKEITSDYLSNENFKLCYLPVNVGAKGFYGHRIYAAFSHLVNEKYILFLDPDCWFENNHVESCIKSIEEKNLKWSYSLRKIYDKEGNFVCSDDCESLGKWKAWTDCNLIDTNSYCITKEIMIKLTPIWHGGWGVDREFLSVLMQHFPNYECTGLYTSNYRLGGNPGSVTKEFFQQGNKVMNDFYKGNFPWRKN